MKKTDKLKHYSRLNITLLRGFYSLTPVYKSKFFDTRFILPVRWDSKREKFVKVDYTRDSFLTLTQRVSSNANDIQRLHKEKTKLIQALKRHFGLRYYVSVSEYTKAGLIHYHIILFRVPYIPKDFIEKFWTLGFSFISASNDKGSFYYLLSYLNKAKKGQKHLRITWSKSFQKDSFFSFSTYIYAYYKKGVYNTSINESSNKILFFYIKGLQSWIDRNLMLYKFLVSRIFRFASSYFLTEKAFTSFLYLLEKYYYNFPESIDLGLKFTIIK